MTGKAVSFGLRDVDPKEKPVLVKGVFDRVAERYDLMNDAMSLGLHRLWKDAAAARVNPQPGELIIDCAGGTGDLARRLSAMARAAARRRGGRAARIIVIDYNPKMVAVGRARGGDGVFWAVGDAEGLPLAAGAADGVCMAFGLRNMTDIEGALREVRRVLKRGGRFICLEFSKPIDPHVRKAYDLFSFGVIPKLGERLGRHREAYQYLVESIRRFPDQARLSQLMAGAGFSRVSATNFAGGACALHQGWAI